ncbi:MAG TPA: copper chaperone PCu(A)C [Thermohalobaculum sp.]|nr:copper chaperone PCu(A)C [Thermohalobaculum sp.]
MKRLCHALPAILALCLVTLLAVPAPAGGGIEVVHPWARPSIPNRPGVVYLGIHNLGDAPDRLVGARAGEAGSAELHKAEQKDGLMRMSPVEAIEVPAGGMAHLGPGGLHIMLFDLAAPLKAGDSLALTLRFERAGEVPVTVPVMRDGHQHGGAHGHGDTGHGDTGHGGAGHGGAEN